SLRLAQCEEERSNRIKRVLSLVGMQERMLHMPGQMSGGEQQRIAIARAVAPRPKVIFADEPTGALDTDTGLKCMTLFKNLIANEGVTIVMTTHDPNLMELGDVIYEMEDGEIIDRRSNI
ncbi:MAG: ATP-binding cassette domain-containing protein, partial [Lachnospiraceae bacterium]|nr:ATP-binding cassette domain-containing protein [Lachnospiraceae bacterium]